MKTIILAAGKGSRLLPYTDIIHKALLVVREKPMIEEQVDLLNSLGIKDIAVVVGYKGEQIRNVLGTRVKYYENLDYDKTNSVYSLWLAKDFLDDDILVLNGDLVVHPDIMLDLIADNGDMTKVVAVGKFNPTGHNVVAKGRLVVDTGAHYTKEETIGEYAGMNKISKRKILDVKEALDQFVNSNKVNEWYETVFNDMIKNGHEMNYISTNGRWWFEIDFPEELEFAKNFFKNLDNT